MQFLKEISILQYLDITVIIMLSGRELKFDLFLKNIHFFQRNGIEVVVVIDEAQTSEVFTILKKFPTTNWKVFTTKQPNNDSIRLEAINTAIQESSNQFVYILDLKTEFITDVLYQLRYAIFYYQVDYAFGLTETCKKTENNPIVMNLQSLLDTDNALIDKDYLIKQGTRLRDQVPEGIFIPEALVRLHLVYSDCSSISYQEAIARHRTKLTEFISSHQIVIKIIFDWKYFKSQLYRKQLLESFEEFWTPNSDVFDRIYKVICLVQIRNEAHIVNDFLEHMDDHCDGIILLDDGSDDLSFENAVSQKLILKVRKKYERGFDDLGNRNALLRLGSIFCTDWYIFMDADERFDNRSVKLNRQPFLESSYDTIVFRIVHLWDSPTQYRTDIPVSDNGILYRYRMFKNKGFMQIFSDRTLHFPATPFVKNVYKDVNHSLILHYGNMNSSNRMAKFIKYSVNDPGGKMQGHGYNFLVDEDYKLADVKNIKV